MSKVLLFRSPPTCPEGSPEIHLLHMFIVTNRESQLPDSSFTHWLYFFFWLVTFRIQIIITKCKSTHELWFIIIATYNDLHHVSNLHIVTDNFVLSVTYMYSLNSIRRFLTCFFSIRTIKHIPSSPMTMGIHSFQCKREYPKQMKHAVIYRTLFYFFQTR